MKCVCKMIILACTTFSFFATDLNQDFKNESFRPYSKLSSSISYQGVGFGMRHRNLLARRGHDLPLNINLFPLTLIEGDPFFFSSHKHTWLKYKSNDRVSSYTGFGVEGLVIMDSSFKRVPMINAEYIIGKEWEKGRFSQRGVNIVPLISAIGGLTLIGVGGVSSGLSLVGASFSALVSYTVGF